MHIGMVLASNRAFPPDIRVEKEALALSQAGHRVTILSQRIPGDSAEYEELSGRKVYVKRVMIKRNGTLDTIRSVVCLIESGWLEHLDAFIHQSSIDVFHVHDFKMVPTVLYVAKRLNVPVVADLHENIPAAFVARRSDFGVKERIKHTILRNYRYWRWQEARKLKQCKRVIVVVPEAAERLLRYGIEREKVIIVSNTEDETTFSYRVEDAERSILDRYKNYWMVSYIGGIGPHRGLDTLLAAVPMASGRIRNLKLAIVGARDQDSVWLKARIRKLRIEPFVDIIDWQPMQRARAYLVASRACLIPHNDFEHTQTTVPHKLFQAMICERPVLVSSVRPLKRIVEESNAGFVFRANDSADLAEKLVEMFTHPDQMVKLGKNGRTAALGKYAWRNDAGRLITMYQELEACIERSIHSEKRG